LSSRGIYSSGGRDERRFQQAWFSTRGGHVDVRLEWGIRKAVA
jgi:hypothetical protein